MSAAVTSGLFRSSGSSSAISEFDQSNSFSRSSCGTSSSSASTWIGSSAAASVTNSHSRLPPRRSRMRDHAAAYTIFDRLQARRGETGRHQPPVAVVLGRVHADHRRVGLLGADAGDADDVLVEHAVAAVLARGGEEPRVLGDRRDVVVLRRSHQKPRPSFSGFQCTGSSRRSRVNSSCGVAVGGRGRDL